MGVDAKVDLADSPASLGVLEDARPHHRLARYPFAWVLLLCTSDILMFALAVAASTALVLRFHPLKLQNFEPVIASSSIIILFQMLIFERLGLYRQSFALSLRDVFYYASAAIVIGALPVFGFFTLLPQLSSSRLIILVSLAFSILGVGATRAVIHHCWDLKTKRRPRRIAIVGRLDRTQAAARSLNMIAGTQVLRIDIDDLDESIARLRPLFESDLSEVAWFDQARRWGCDALMLTEALPPRVVPALLRAAAKNRIKVAFTPPRFRVHAYSAHLETDGEQALIVFSQLTACMPLARMLKRMFDIVFSSAALALAIPILVWCALAIVLDSRGPIFYRQARVGVHGEIFEILKLRSMRVDAERSTGPVWAQPGDLRVTRVGRFLRRTSLDELPQLFNVLRGDMSVVGPRPERPQFVERFRQSLARYDERHLVRPGITGWSQINLRRGLRPADVGEKLGYDLFYIEHWSLFLDVSIIAKTVIEFLFHDAA